MNVDLYLFNLIVRCEGGWSEFDNHCYYYDVGTKVNWTVAEESCKQKDSQLASVYSNDELKFMRKLSSKDYTIKCGSAGFEMYWGWIGGATYKGSRNCTMIYDDTDINEIEDGKLWAIGEPNDRSSPEDCIEVRCFEGDLGSGAGKKLNDTFRLYDHTCFARYHFFCKKKVAEKVPETTQSTQTQPDKGKIH